MNPMMNNSIVEQLLNLRIQLHNIGINSFNIDNNICMNCFNYSGVLKNISDKINLIINGNNIKKQFMMNQQIMMPNQMIHFAQFYQAENENLNKEKINFVFRDFFQNIYYNKINNKTKEIKNIEELLNQYI